LKLLLQTTSGGDPLPEKISAQFLKISITIRIKRKKWLTVFNRTIPMITSLLLPLLLPRLLPLPLPQNHQMQLPLLLPRLLPLPLPQNHPSSSYA
jgi:hypothetical protein